MYKERRFARLGYSAGAIFECIPQFKKLLQRTTKNNLLVRACRLYLESDFVIAALKALSNFTYFITMPFLNCVEQCNQNDLVNILPELHKELLSLKYKNQSLLKYKVPWKHVKMENQELVSDLEIFIMNKMCTSAAAGLELQCSREYWNPSDKGQRATQIHRLTEEERENLPTENLCAERYLAKFGALASDSAKHSNKFFKAKRIKDDLCLIVSNECEYIHKKNRKLYQMLDIMEQNWTHMQKELFKGKLKESFKRKNRDSFSDAVLNKCKEHGGPITCLEDLNKLLGQHDDESLKRILRQELQYQRVHQSRDCQERPELYKVNNLSVEEMSNNLLLMFSNPDEGTHEMLFHTEEEIMSILDGAPTSTKSSGYSFQQPLAIVWDIGDVKEWFIGFHLDANSDEEGTFQTVRVDHMEKQGACKKKWIRPKQDDIQDVQEQQILPCKVLGDWEVTSRSAVFNVQNAGELQGIFDDLFSN